MMDLRWPWWPSGTYYAKWEPVQPSHRRLGCFRKEGRWLKSDTIAIDKTRYVVVSILPEGEHEYAAIDYSNQPGLLPLQLAGQPMAVELSWKDV